MAPISFARAVSPVLVAEAMTCVASRFAPESNGILLTVLLMVTVAVLPLLAGFRVLRSGGLLRHACLGGIAISLVTLLCAAVAELATSADWNAFEGFVLATIVIAVPLQALFGLLGGWFSLRGFGHGA